MPNGGGGFRGRFRALTVVIINCVMHINEVKSEIKSKMNEKKREKQKRVQE